MAPICLSLFGVWLGKHKVNTQAASREKNSGAIQNVPKKHNPFYNVGYLPGKRLQRSFNLCFTCQGIMPKSLGPNRHKNGIWG